MAIFFAGDPHGNFKPLISAVKEHCSAAVVILGDMDLEEPMQAALAEITSQTEIYWIPGNHECDRVTWYDNSFCCR